MEGGKEEEEKKTEWEIGGDANTGAIIGGCIKPF